MATNRTDASRYPSRYGGGWVTHAQYMTECLCVLIARREKKELFEKFWNQEPWKAVFRKQVPLAIKLLKEHPPEVILEVLRDRRCWKIQSFGAKWLLKPLLIEKQRIHDATKAQQSDKVLEKTSTVDKPRRVLTGKKSLFSQLKEAEHGKKEEGCTQTQD